METTIVYWGLYWIYAIDPNYEGFGCRAGARSLGGEGFAIALHMSTSCREAIFLVLCQYVGG